MAQLKDLIVNGPSRFIGTTYINGYTLNKTVPSDAVFTDTDTWRTIQCNGTSIGNNTLNLKAGSNISLSNNGSGTITINATNTTYSFTDHNPTLSWGTKSKVATVGGTAIHVTMPSAPTFTESYRGTVTSVTPGTGLTGTNSDTAITSSGTINLKTASSGEIGGICIGYTQSGKNYPVALDGNNKAYVYVPWTDTNTDTNTWRPIYNGVDSTSTDTSASANAVKTAYDLANSKWTYDANTIAGVKVNNAVHADTAGSAVSAVDQTARNNASAAAGTVKSVNVSSSSNKFYLVGHTNSVTNTTATVAKNTTIYCQGTGTSSAIITPVLKVSNPNSVLFTDGGDLFTWITGLINNGGSSTSVTDASWDSTEYSTQFYGPVLKLTMSDGGVITSMPFPIADNVRAGVVTAGAQGFAGDKTFLGSVTSKKGFFDTSDERLKNFEESIEVDFEKLAKLRKSYFTWKDSENTEMQIGVSAQEVQELYPELVSTDENGTLHVAYNKLSVVALKAIDKLNEKIESLEERLSKIETFLNKL